MKTITTQDQFIELMKKSGVQPDKITSIIQQVTNELNTSVDHKPTPTIKIPGYNKRLLLHRAVDCFINARSTKLRFGHYFIDGNELYYRTVQVNRNNEHMLNEELLAIRLDSGIVLANSSALNLGPKKDNQTEAQSLLALCMPMVPFSVFEQLGLDLDSLVIVDKGDEESIVRSVSTGKFEKPEKGEHRRGKEIFKDETVHFTGASLYQIGDTQFLFDIDRREVKHKIFNPFIVKLPAPCKSIQEAYQCLKPQEVIDAESNGVTVKRQGEWYFLPAPKKIAERLNKENVKTENLVHITLRAGNNRPNTAKGVRYDPKADTVWVERNDRSNYKDLSAFPAYLTSKVEHTGREHAALLLKGWWVAIPNTATESFTLSGDID